MILKLVKAIKKIAFFKNRILLIKQATLESP